MVIQLVLDWLIPSCMRLWRFKPIVTVPGNISSGIIGEIFHAYKALAHCRA
jgi:hypothetical protein